jgi:DNA-binding CsgD family transcriptional regulator
MAQAGRVWTATLAGSVDPDAVEAAAHGLASAGLGWDGARLAGHGASRATDRKISARLLSCARELHPNESLRKSARADDENRPPSSGSERVVLSERELDVARLVLQGKTYAEIGETIFISPRTAEHHIAHMRRRLGAASRSDLIAKLRVVVEQAAQYREPAPADEGLPA